MADGTAVRPTLRGRGRGSGTDGGSNTSADSRTKCGPAPAASDRAERGPCAGAEETTAERALGRIVGVCSGCRCK